MRVNVSLAIVQRYFSAIDFAYNQTKNGHCAKREARVHLAPLVTEKAAVQLLQRRNVLGHSVHVDLGQAVVRAEYL